MGREPDEARRTLREDRARRDALGSELEEVDQALADLGAKIVSEARVLGVTGTGAFLRVREIGQVDMAIIDEASMLPLPMVWFVGGMSRERVVVCGDFRQIPAIVSTRHQAVHDAIGRNVFAAAGVDALNDGDERLVMLDTQRRMHEDICALISGPMYGGRLRTDPDPGWRAARSRCPRPPAPFEAPLTLVDTSVLNPVESVTASSSRYNMMHALLVRNLAWHLKRSGFLQGMHDLGVCTPYRAQANLIREMLGGESLEEVQVGTVHSFQGDEPAAVVMEIPESPGASGRLGGFVQGAAPDDPGARLINVAVSRAQNHLIVIANLAHLDRLLPANALLRSILFDMQARGNVIPADELMRLRPLERDLEGVDAHVGLFNRRSFDLALARDIGRARDSVVIFSAFAAPRRVSQIRRILQDKVDAGVRVRCVTRAPRLSPLKAALGEAAVKALEEARCVVDCRAQIHEKVVIIDRRILWNGSLNALSYSYATDEFMTRMVSENVARMTAAMLSKRNLGPKRALRELAERENPPCGQCGSRTYHDERFRGVFRCMDMERCKWKIEASHAPESEDTPCRKCGGKTVLRQGRHGPFRGCADYPRCDGKPAWNQTAG